jgi:Ca2+-transporting ATPase
MDTTNSRVLANLPSGLSSEEAASLHIKYGRNALHKTNDRRVVVILWEVVKEPMFVLLALATLLYFFLGEVGQGILMLVAMVLVAGISIFQEVRSSHALQALHELTEPNATILRNGIFQEFPADEIVPGDIVRIEEGERVAADGWIILCNDLSVNEAIVTGESMPVDKSAAEGQNQVYQGTTVNTGIAFVRITLTGNHTLLGQLGQSIRSIHSTPTVLQKWISGFVRAMAIFGVSAFVLIWLINYWHSGNLLTSLLTGLTIAMSAIPEEVPVAFSSFMALGALHLTKLGIVVRQSRIVENLGALTILCLDKTGTLTENCMRVKAVYDAQTNELEQRGNEGIWRSARVLWYARLASEVEPFDAMEKAIVQAFEETNERENYPSMHMIHEYPLNGQPPMMTHVYEGDGLSVVAAKGAPERILRVCKLPEIVRIQWQRRVNALASEGCRVLGICSAAAKEYPADQDNFDWQFEGMVALYDAPKAGLDRCFGDWRNAGIRVKIISGDHVATVRNIARTAGLDGELAVLTGEEVMSLTPAALASIAGKVDIYARMFPEAKTRVIEALKNSGAIVAMSGDGVNDGPALRSAHIGIAIGKKGTEIARQAADLVISDDDLDKITQAIRYGRAVRVNLRKAIRYLITIHIPIILTASMPLLLGWNYPTVFTPVHIIFLELIMGPTCSIYFEREPIGSNVMTEGGKSLVKGLLAGRLLLLTVLQGLLAATGLLGLYHFHMVQGDSLSYTRTIVFITLWLDNILLTVVGSQRNPLFIPVLLASLSFLCLIYFVPFARELFGMVAVRAWDVLIALVVSLFTVGWYMVYRWTRSRS